MSAAIFNFDASILLWIQAHLRGVLDPVVVFITHLGDKGLLWIALTLILLIPRRTRRVGVTSAVSMLIGLVVVNIVLKNWIARTRPYELIEGLQLMIEKQHDFSFPSGHATNSLACAWVLFRGMRKRYGVPALILALLICFSRLYVGVHYPTDVFAGIAVGIAAAECARAVVSALRRRFPAFRDFIRPSKKKKRRAKRA
ncbi:MAG: phosphatase PAP2 family protein [Clostridia bacterium]|nr:phosphatase PAP2 family protein [Clostridia bacterium]